MLVAGNKKPRTKAGLGLRGRQADLSQPPETTKPVSDGLYRCSNMAEAMGFELMDLLQSTVFKTDMKITAGCGVQPSFTSETYNF